MESKRKKHIDIYDCIIISIDVLVFFTLREIKKRKFEKQIMINSILQVVNGENNLNPKYKMLVEIKDTKVYLSNNLLSKRIGSINESERVRYKSLEGEYTKIIYSTKSNLKEGYVLSSDVKIARIIPDNFNNLSNYSGVINIKLI